MNHRHSIALGGASFETRLCTLALATDQIIDVVAPQGSYAVFWRFDSWVAVLFSELAVRLQVSIDVLTSTETAPRVIREPKWWPANLDPSPVQPFAYGFAAVAASHVIGTDDDVVPPKESVRRIEARSVQPNLLPDTPEIQARARAAAMFREFDRYTHPSFYDEQINVVPPHPGYAVLDDGSNLTLEYRFRKLLTTRVMQVLAERVASRWHHGEGDPPKDLKKAYEVWLGYLSSLQLTFYRRWFGNLSSDVSVSELANAFIWFGSGMLLLRSQPDTWALAETIGDISQGGPDGTAICLFVEFAFAALESNVDATVWVRLLPGLLAMVEAYASAYGGGVRIPPGQYPAVPRNRPNNAQLKTLHDTALGRGEILRATEIDSDIAGFVEQMEEEFARLLRSMFTGGYSVTGVRSHVTIESDLGPT